MKRLVATGSFSGSDGGAAGGGAAAGASGSSSVAGSWLSNLAPSILELEAQARRLRGLLLFGRREIIREEALAQPGQQGGERVQGAGRGAAQQVGHEIGVGG